MLSGFVEKTPRDTQFPSDEEAARCAKMQVEDGFSSAVSAARLFLLIDRRGSRGHSGTQNTGLLGLT